MSQILLSELIPILNIQNGDALLDVRDVASVEFSDEHLVTVDEVSGLITYNDVADTDVGEKDFLLTSEAPFQTDEKLTVTLTNGEVIEVGVTDASEDRLEYDIDGRETLMLSEILKVRDNQNVFKALGPYRDRQYYIYWYLYNNENERIASGGGYYDGNDTDSIISGVANIPYKSTGYIQLWQYANGTWNSNLKFNNDDDRIYLIQNKKPVVPEANGAFIYEIKDGEAVITDVNPNYDGNGVVIVPTTVELEDYGVDEMGVKKSYPVNKIKNKAFFMDEKLTQVTFADSDTPLLIEDDAFFLMTNLTSVSGDRPVQFQSGTGPVFDRNAQLKSLTLHIDGTRLPINQNDALQDLELYIDTLSVTRDTFTSINSVENLTLHVKNITVGTSAFNNNDALRTLTVYNENPTSIGAYAFSNKTNLTSVTFTGVVTAINDSAFAGDTALTTVSLGNTAEDALTIQMDAFKDCAVLEANNVICPQTVYSEDGIATIPAVSTGVPLGAMPVVDTSIEPNEVLKTFAENWYKEQGEINPIEAIVYFDLSLKNSGGVAATGVPADVLISNVVGHQISIGTDVMTVDNNSRQLFHLTKEGVVERVDFEDEGFVEDKIRSLSFSVNSFSPFVLTLLSDKYHDDTFWYDLDVTDPDNIMATIAGLYNENATEVMVGPTTNDDYKFPVVAVADSALKGENGITKITFNNTKALMVGDYAFAGMTGLTSIVVNGSGALTIGKTDWNGAFNGCSSLNEISGTGTGAVSFNAMGTFQGCNTLAKVSLNNIALIGRNTFLGDSWAEQTPLSVIAGRIEKIDYQGFNTYPLALLHCKTGNPEMEKNWDGSVYHNIMNLVIRFDDGITLENGYGGAFTVEEGNTITFKAENKNRISICKWGLGNSNLTAVDITAPSVEIGDSAFSGCGKLETVKITGDVTKIDSWAFNNCSILDALEIKGDIGEITSKAFNGCSTLASIKFDQNVETIGSDAFYNCAVENFEVVGNIQALKNAFSGSKDNAHTIKTFKVGGNVDTIEGWAFNWCSNLNTVEIGGNVGTVRAYAFNECGKLDKLIILGSADEIQSLGFRTANLRVAVLKGGVGKVEDGAFTGGENTQKPFHAEENLVYIGNKSGTEVGSTAFGDDAAIIYFNMAKDDVNGTPKQKKVYYADGTIPEDIHVTPDYTGEESDGTESKPFASCADAMEFVAPYAEGSARFKADATAAGVADLNLPFNSGLESGNGITLHISTTDATEVEIPAGVFDGSSSLAAIVFENGPATQINIAAGALKNCAALERVEIKNSDAKVFIGNDAFDGCAKLNSTCAVEQTVESDAGKVTLPAGANAPIGTMLVKTPVDTENAEINQRITKYYEEFDTPIVEHYDLHLEDIHGNVVEGVAADVALAMEIPATAWRLAIFHNTGSDVDVVRITQDNITTEADKIVESRFHVNSLSPFATAYCKGTPYHDDMFWYELNHDDEDHLLGAVITGIYDGTAADGTAAYVGDTLVFSGKTRDEKEFPVIAIAAHALKNSEITTVVFTNNEALGVGEDAFAGCTGLKTVIEAGKGAHETAYEGAETLAFINAPDALDEHALDDVTTVYFGAPIGNDVAKAIANAQTVYINAKKVDSDGAEALDALLSAKGDLVPQVYYLESEEPRGELYIAGTPVTDSPTGTKDAPFNTFDQLSEAIGGSNGTNVEPEQITENASGMADAINAILNENSINHTVPVEFKRTLKGPYTIYVINAVQVQDAQTWNSDKGDPIVLNRYPENTDAMVNVTSTGTLTLKNVVLDGGRDKRLVANEAMIKVTNGTLNIKDGALLRNNFNAHNSEEDEIYSNDTMRDPTGGGAVYAKNATVNMDGGKITENESHYGGGLHIQGSKGKFNFSGGEITENLAYGIYPYGSGGGVCANDNATMTMTGGTIRKNRAEDGISVEGDGACGGGICLGLAGSNWALSNYHKGKLYLYGGTIDENYADLDGGGIMVQCSSEAWVEAKDGKRVDITNNKAIRGRFGGGGVYVNGVGGSTVDGKLYVNNAVITANTTDNDEGGKGIASCETSSLMINIGDGAIITGNGGEDIVLAHSGDTAHLESISKVAISPNMLGGGSYNWLYSDGTPVELSSLYGENFMRIHSNPTAEDLEKAYECEPQVYITGNYAKQKGGGIGSNGTVIIGNRPGMLNAEWNPDAKKILHHRDGEDDEIFSFSVREEKHTYDETFGIYKVYPLMSNETVVARGSVSGADLKDGTAVDIQFDSIVDFKNISFDLGDSKTNHVGDEHVFTIVEDAPEETGDVIYSRNYYAVTIKLLPEYDSEKDEMVIVPTEIGRSVGKLVPNPIGSYDYEYIDCYFIRDDDGTPLFYQGEGGRKRTDLEEGEKGAFENFACTTSVSAGKTWLGIDGETPKATLSENASATFKLLADGEAVKDVDGNDIVDIILDGVPDENGEDDAWTATFKNLPVYQTDEDGKLVTDADGEYVKIQYTVVETDWSPKEDYKPDYGVDENGEKKMSVEVDSKTVGEIKNVETGVPEIALPETGGHGTAGLYLAGGMLILLGLALLIAKRRRTND